MAIIGIAIIPKSISLELEASPSLNIIVVVLTTVEIAEFDILTVAKIVSNIPGDDGDDVDDNNVDDDNVDDDDVDDDDVDDDDVDDDDVDDDDVDVDDDDVDDDVDNDVAVVVVAVAATVAVVRELVGLVIIPVADKIMGGVVLAVDDEEIVVFLPGFVTRTVEDTLMVGALAMGDEVIVTKLSVGLVSLTTGGKVLENNVLVATGDEMTSIELPMEIVSLIIADEEIGGDVITDESVVVVLVVVISEVLMTVVGVGVLIIVVVETAVVVGVTIIQRKLVNFINQLLATTCLLKL